MFMDITGIDLFEQLHNSPQPHFSEISRDFDLTTFLNS